MKVEGEVLHGYHVCNKGCKEPAWKHMLPSLVSDKDFLALYPMRQELEYLALKEFSKEVGAPDVLVCDGSKTQNQHQVKLLSTQMGTTPKKLAAETQWANRAELAIRIIKEATQKDLRASRSPIVLWDYCMERRALIFQATSKKLFQLHG